MTSTLAGAGPAGQVLRKEQASPNYKLGDALKKETTDRWSPFLQGLVKAVRPGLPPGSPYQCTAYWRVTTSAPKDLRRRSHRRKHGSVRSRWDIRINVVDTDYDVTAIPW